MSVGKWLFLLLWLGYLLSGSAFSQTLSPFKVFGRYQQFIWQEQHGLPQNTVQAITRTRDGYLWLGTLAGVARFDGAHFTVFDNGNTGAIKGSYITALLQDRQGNLWLTADSGGLVHYRGGQFSGYPVLDGFSADSAQKLLEDSEGSLWVGAYGGIVRFKDKRFTAYTTGNGLPDAQVTALAEDPEGGLWVGTTNGLARFKDGHSTVYTTRDGLPHNYVMSLYQDSSGTLWVGTNNGLCQFQNHHFVQTGIAQELAHIPIFVLYQDREDNLLIGTLGNGLFCRKGNRFERYSTKDGLPGDRVVAIYQDPEGDLWIGTDGGLCQLRAGRFQTYTVQDGLQPDFVSAIFEDSAGNLWIGTTNGLNRFKDGQFTAYKAKDGMPARYIRSIFQDRTGALWIGSDGGGLTRMQNGRFTTWTVKDGLANDVVNAVCEDRNGNLWVGTGGGGLNCFKAGVFTRYTTKDGLAGNSIRNLFEDRAGNLWIGTQSNGVSRFKDGQFTNWTTRDGLAGNTVVSFCEDYAGNLWMGTLDGGVSRYKDGKFASIAARDGLYDNIAFRMLADTDDDSANLWMSCNKGIYRVSLKELNEFADGHRQLVTSFVYGVTDGMLSRECNSASPAGWRTRDGLLWFPTTRGLVKIDPQSRNAQPPLLAIEQVRLDRMELPVGQVIEINPGQENLEIAYTGLSWSRPQQIRFKYQLLGLDHDWVDAGTRRTAYYPHLPPGEYTFKVIADNGEGVWNVEGVSLRVKVLPPFYRTWWFTTLLALTVIGLVTSVYQIRVRQLTRAKTAQEAFSRQLITSQEQERKRIAAELHDSLGQNLMVIKNWTTLAKRFLEPESRAREPLDEIAQSVSHSIAEVREIAYNLRPYHLDEIGLTGAIHSMIEKVADSSGIQFKVEIDSINGLLTSEAEINLYRVIQECLNNIVKHSQANVAEINIGRDLQTILTVIKDYGVGFVLEEVMRRKDHGFGLTGISERVHLLGGRQSIESTPGKGTTITIWMGLEKTDYDK